MPDTIDQHIQDFLNYLQFQKRYSRHTIISYETDLLACRDFLAVQFGEMPVAQIKSAFIRTWLASLKDSGQTARTINRKISALKSFFKYQIKIGQITSSPMAVINAPKNNKRLPQFVDREDMALLFEHVSFSDDWEGHTSRLILEILYNCGLRQTELIQLNQHHVDFSNAALKVLGKGNKERIIPISGLLMKSIREYINLKTNTFPNTNCAALLLNKKGKALGARYVYTVVKKYLSLVTSIEKRSPHVLRHSFATHLTNSGADLNAVKELLGHSSLAATQVYTHNSIEKLKDAFKKAHPKA
jgi:integrase/recombinase XerC